MISASVSSFSPVTVPAPSPSPRARASRKRVTCFTRAVSPPFCRTARAMDSMAAPETSSALLEESVPGSEGLYRSSNVWARSVASTSPAR